MKPTNGTIHSSAGLAGVTGQRPTARLRLAGLLLTALLGSVLVIFISRATWRRVEGLQREFSGLKADNFYLGVRMRSMMERLNDTLLRYRLRGDTNDLVSFYAGASDFRQWLGENSTNIVSPAERQFYDQVRSAYEEYLSASEPILRASLGHFPFTQGREFKNSYEKIQTQSEKLLRLCDAFVSDQRSSFARFMEESNQTLSKSTRLLQLTLLLLLSLGAVLVALVYRGMIAPLRHQLSETHAILARQEKLASLGVLAAGVAHEIRNPLTAIKFRLYTLRKTLAASGSGNEDAVMIGNEISRLERIVRDFLQFARPSEPQLISLPARRILEDVHSLLGPQLKKMDIELKLEGGDSAWIRADTEQMKQVLINLVQNSADSIGRNGVITLRARKEPGAGRKSARNAIILDVSDTGKGIPPEARKRLFDPFFTTKEGGTGLGLPISARIVEKHGGELRWQTEVNRGTTFSIVLPRANENET